MGLIWDDLGFGGFGDDLQTSWPGSLTPRGLARILGEVPSDLGKGINTLVHKETDFVAEH